MSFAEVLTYARERYATEPEYLWSSDPDYAVLRHKRNKKWYAVLMPVPKSRLGLAGEGVAEIVNVKLEPELVQELREQEGYLPAYHMNKAHWLSIVLEGTVSPAQIRALLDRSYALTEK